MLATLAKAVERIIPPSRLKSADRKLEMTGIPLSSSEYLSIIFLIIVVLTPLAILVLRPTPYFPLALTTPLVIFFIFYYAIPYGLRSRRVTQMENMLPEVLRQMALTLRAGLGIEGAMEDVAVSKYGAISEEFEKTLMEIRRGRMVEHALLALGKRVGSVIFDRAIRMVVEGMRMGAALSEVLEAVSNDIRETQRIQRERAATTMMQVSFIAAASGFAAPLAIGMIATIMVLFGTIGAQVFPVREVTYILLGYIAFQALISSLVIGVIRYGEMQRGLKFAALIVPGSIGIFWLVKYLTALLFGT
ncbi:MAG: type II secretion system F family protein [Candidatus Hydrothermarchaeota archaeon]